MVNFESFDGEGGNYTEHEEIDLLRSINHRLAQLSEALLPDGWLAAALSGLAVEAVYSHDALASINATLIDFLTQWEAANTAPPGAATAVLALQIGGHTSMAITVDTTNGNAVLSFEDDKNDPTGPPPGDGSGLVVTFGSDTPTVATVGATVTAADAAGNVTYEAPVAPLKEGVFNLSAVVSNTSGVALTDADGTTVFVQPAAIAVTVSAGQAASGTLSTTP